MEIRIEIEGLPELYAKLGRNLLPIIQPAILAAVIRAEGKMKVYPPPPPGSTYVRGLDPRSERLGQRWTHQVVMGGDFVRGEIGNNASYAPWVQSSEFQARIHRGRWTTDEDALREVLPKLQDDLRGVVVRGLTG